MSYQVLARRLRPRDFKGLIGQDHVVRALSNGLDSGRVHHAYLFTGTRGVGKTTIARILAKSLNCEAGVSSTPCGSCSICREIEENRFIDLIEVDAASRTRVDDTRELLDNAQYLPSRGRFKVYLIDEVHMLSASSFNAFLKTLEEPPEHVKFLLATTDPRKVPVTVLSRCLQFQLKNIGRDEISRYIGETLTAEGVEFEPDALRIIARSARGSMRDALSITDQAIAYSQGALTASDVAAMVGAAGRDETGAVIEALASGDPRRVLAISAALADKSADFGSVLSELLEALHDMAVGQALGEAPESAISAEAVQLYYQIALIGYRDLHIGPDPKTGFEMTLLRMLAFAPDAAAAARVPPTAVEPPESTETGPAQAAPVTAPAGVGSTEAARAGTMAAAEDAATRVTAAQPASSSAPRKLDRPAPNAQPEASSAIPEPETPAAAPQLESMSPTPDWDAPARTAQPETPSAAPESETPAATAQPESMSPTPDWDAPARTAQPETPSAAPESETPAATPQPESMSPTPDWDTPAQTAQPETPSAAPESETPAVTPQPELMSPTPHWDAPAAAAQPETSSAAPEPETPAATPQPESQSAAPEWDTPLPVAQHESPLAAPAPELPAATPQPETKSASLGPETPAPASATAMAEPASAAKAAPDTDGNGLYREWHGLVGRLGLTGVERMVAEHSLLVERDGGKCRLVLDRKHESLLHGGETAVLEGALANLFGQPLRLVIDIGDPPHETPAQRKQRLERERVAAARRELEENPTVKSLIETLDGRLEHVRPLDGSGGEAHGANR